MHIPSLAALAPALWLAMAQANVVQSTRAIDTALLQASEHDELGNSDQPQSIERSAQVRYELGAVVDVRRTDHDGLPVLAITPGSAAERLGLQVGDRLLAINGHRLDSGIVTTALLEQALQAGDGKLDIAVRRNKQEFNAKGEADAMGIPAYRIVIGDPVGKSCGYLSTTAGTPPLSKGVFRAFITRIDGRSTPPGGKPRYQLAAGKHVLSVAADIDSNYLTPTQVQQIHRMNQRTGSRPYKPLVIDVQPGIGYRIGARLRRDHLDSQSFQNNAYWEPVIWETTKESCP